MSGDFFEQTSKKNYFLGSINDQWRRWMSLAVFLEKSSSEWSLRPKSKREALPLRGRWSGFEYMIRIQTSRSAALWLLLFRIGHQALLVIKRLIKPTISVLWITRLHYSYLSIIRNNHLDFLGSRYLHKNTQIYSVHIPTLLTPISFIIDFHKSQNSEFKVDSAAGGWAYGFFLPGKSGGRIAMGSGVRGTFVFVVSRL